MTWMLTRTGAQPDLRRIEPSCISVLDIATGLAQTNRFQGQAFRPYSVAEHSLLVYLLASRMEHVGSEGLLAALMHDAHEAYCGDTTQPMKQLLGATWSVVEDRIQAEVLERFDLLHAYRFYRKLIKLADRQALSIERHFLLPPVGPAWGCLEGIAMPTGIELELTDSTSWTFWRDEFLTVFGMLMCERALATRTLPAPAPAPKTEVIHIAPPRSESSAAADQVRPIALAGARKSLCLFGAPRDMSADVALAIAVRNGLSRVIRDWCHHSPYPPTGALLVTAQRPESAAWHGRAISYASAIQQLNP